MGPPKDLLLGTHGPSSIQELSFPSEPFVARLTAASACSPWPHCAAQRGFDLLLASEIRDAIDVRKKQKARKKGKNENSSPSFPSDPSVNGPRELGVSYKSSNGDIRWSESTGNVSLSPGWEAGIAACGRGQLN